MQRYVMAMLVALLVGCGGLKADVLLELDRAIERSHALAVAPDATPAEQEVGWVTYDALWAVRYSTEGGTLPPDVRARSEARRAEHEAREAKATAEAGW